MNAGGLRIRLPDGRTGILLILLHAAVLCGLSINLEPAPNSPPSDVPVSEKAVDDGFDALRIMVADVAEAVQGADKA